MVMLCHLRAMRSGLEVALIDRGEEDAVDTGSLQLASPDEYRGEDQLVVVLQAVVVQVEGFQEIKDVIGSVQNPIPYCRGKVGKFALVHGLRTAHLSHGGIEQLLYLVGVPGGCARA